MSGNPDSGEIGPPATRGALRVSRVRDAAAFRALERDWERLLAASAADRLFLGWPWQYSWWETWGAAHDLELYLLLAHRDDELVGIAPLYLDRVRLEGRLQVARLQFIGNMWRRQATVRTEYLEFICVRDQARAVNDALLDYLAQARDWDELLICDATGTSETYRCIAGRRPRRPWFAFIREVEYGVRVDTSGDFGEFVAALGRNTRLKLYSHRKYLAQFGEVATERATPEGMDGMLDLLNGFHRARWGRDCFGPQPLAFHRRLLARLGPEREADLECIRVDGRAISVIYNIRAGDTVYNLQSGFDEDFDRKLSPGTLHMGLALERAFGNPAVTAFDLLAGKGRREYYKTRYRGTEVKFITLQVARRPLLQLIYRVYLLLPARLRRANSAAGYLQGDR